MKLRTGIRIAVWGSLAAVLILIYDHYSAYAMADKACLRAGVGAPADRAKANLREAATASGTVVRESGERTSAVFHSMFSEAACTFVARDGKIVERSVGRKAPDAAR